MADIFKTTKITQSVPGGPLNEQLIGVVSASSGPPDAGKIVALSSTGMLDPSIGGGTSVYVNGSPITNPDFGQSPSPPVGYSSVVWVATGSNVNAYYSTTGSAVAFSDISSGDNLTATMTVDTGASLAPVNDGVVGANEIYNDTGTELVSVTGGAPTHAGMLLISQPGNTTVAFADPQVQGLYAAGSSISSPPSYVAPTTIQPVLIGGSQSGNLEPFLQDGSGYLYVNIGANSFGTITVSGTVAATQSGSWTVAATQSGSWTVGVSGTVAATQSGTWTGVGVNLSDANGNPITSSDISGTYYLHTVDLSVGGTGSPVPIAATYIGFSDGGNLTGISSSNPLPVNATFAGTVTTSLPPDRNASGNINSNGGTVILSCNPGGGGTISINISGMWSGTLAFQGSADGTHYVTSDVTPYPFGSLINSTTGNGTWQVAAGGLYSFQVIATAWTSGTATIAMELGIGANQIVIADVIQGAINVSNFPAVQTVSGNVTAAQGSGGTAASAWYVYVTDGTNILGTSSHPIETTFTNTSINADTHDGSGNSIGSTSDSGTLGLNVHVTNTGGLGGTQYVEGTSIGATGTGTLAIAKNPSNDAEGLHVDASNNLLVNVNTALPAGSNLIGEVEVSNGTNVIFTSSHPGVTEDTSDGAVGTGTQPTTAMQVAGWDGSNLTVLSTTSNGYLNTNATVSGTFTPALTSDRMATGNITGTTQSVSISTQGAWSCIMNVTGAWMGTLTPEFLMPDGVTWVSGSVFPTLPGGSSVSTITANGQWQIPVGGIQSFRLYCTAYTSGTAVVSIEVGAGGYSVAVHQGTAANLNATVTQAAGTWSDNITEVGGSSLSLGQKTSANSIPVVVASDQSSISATLQASSNNIGYVGYELPTSSRLSTTAINFSASGNTTLVPGVSGQTVRVFRLMFNVGGSTTIEISDGSTTFCGPLTFTATGGFILDFSGEPWFVSGISNGFVFNSSASVQVGGTVWYTQS
jgi:hypothetical protein